VIHVGFWCQRPLPPSLQRLGEEIADLRQLQSCLWDVLLVTRPLPPRAACACRVLLADSAQAAGCRFVAAEQAVSFGLSRRDSLTLAAMERQRVLCVQRRLTTLSGRIVEPQELPLPQGTGPQDDLWLLAEAGLTLLLDL